MFTFSQTLKNEIAKKAVSLGFDSSVADTMADRWWQYMTDIAQLDCGNKKHGLKNIEHSFNVAIDKKDRWGFLVGLFDWNNTPERNMYWSNLADS